MKRLKLDTGLRAYRLGEGELRFNPGDPNLYARFLEALEKLPEITGELQAKAGAVSDGPALLALLTDADRRLKALLNWVFGPGNDFDTLLAGQSLLSTDGSGECLLVRLMETLEPLLTAGIEDTVQTQTRQAQAAAQARRAGQ